MLKKSALFFLIFSILVFSTAAYADTREMEMTTYYPAPYGEYKTLSSTHFTNLATTAGKVTIGTVAAPYDNAKLELPQNTVIKLGNAYMSSGGDWGHFGMNTWVNNSAWVYPDSTKGGSALQMARGVISFYTFDPGAAVVPVINVTSAGTVIQSGSLTVATGDVEVTAGQTRVRGGLTLPTYNAAQASAAEVGEIWILG